MLLFACRPTPASSYSYSTNLQSESPSPEVHAARGDPYDAAIAGTSGSVQDPGRTLPWPKAAPAVPRLV